MSNYGVLVVECEGSYQIVAEASSRGEALEMAANYLSSALGHEDEFMAPEAFVVNRQGSGGFYNVREVLSDEDVNEACELLAQVRRLERKLRVGWDKDVQISLENCRHALALLEVAR